MRRAIAAALCSALVIPGLGQIMNHHRRKGAAILLAVFVLFLVAMIWLFHMIRSVAGEITPAPLDPTLVLHRLQEKDLAFLWFLLPAFALLWIFSVLDAFLHGRSIDPK